MKKIIQKSLFKNQVNWILIFVIVLGLTLNYTAAKETISFKTADSLEVTADLYLTNPDKAPFIILFHQANWSRGEYLEIAPKLIKMGFNCMAVDQRSGDKVNGVLNETHRRALEQGKAVE